MSRPMNPLANFHSYAYHHILIACDGTDTADALARHSEITLFDHERAGRRYGVQRLPSSDGKYVVLINGTSDTAFYIASASWSAVMVPREAPNGEQQFHTMISDGEMVIKEPKGIRFYNLLNQVLKDLGTDANGVCFLLKTIFVGQRDDGTTELITNIRPHMFLMYDTSAMFDMTGSEYTINFVSIANGAARLPQTSSIIQGMSLKIDPGMTLQSAVDKLAAEIQKHYREEWAKLKASFECSNPELRFDDEFREVTYRFELDEAYQTMKTGDNGLPISQDTGDNDTIATYQGASASIENILTDIMKSSKQVLDEKDGDPEKGEKFMYKITSVINSGPSKFEVVYQVQRYQAAVVKRGEWLTFEPDPDRGIEFDYIFTGQNVDVKSFDLKFQMGIVFFQVLNSYNNLPSNTGDVINRRSDQLPTLVGGQRQGSSDQQITLKKPLFLGSSAKSVEFRNKRLAAGAMSYNALLQRHAAVESVNARLVIHGNPQLLNESTMLPKSITPVNPEPTSVIQTAETARMTGDDKPRLIMPELYKVPGYVKVNVKMPTLWQEDSTRNDFDFPQDYAQDFWFTGWYFVTEIRNTFEDGEFSQELELVAVIADDGEIEAGNDDKCAGDKPTESTTAQVAAEQGVALQVPTDGVNCVTPETLARVEADLDAELEAYQNTINDFRILAASRPPDDPLTLDDSPVTKAAVERHTEELNRLNALKQLPPCPTATPVDTSAATATVLAPLVEEQDYKKQTIAERRRKTASQIKFKQTAGGA